MTKQTQNLLYVLETNFTHSKLLSVETVMAEKLRIRTLKLLFS